MPATPFIGQIIMFGGNFTISGWASCNGQLLPISQNDALFALIGTQFGGDGQTTFGLPDLRGRVPVHMGHGLGLSSYAIGQKAGVENVTLLTSNLPAHTHTPACNAATGNSADPSGKYWAAQPTLQQYSNAAPTANMNQNIVGKTGGGQPHDNTVPYLTVNYLIALEGVFPSRN